MGLSTPSPLILHAEQEHNRLRLAIIGLLVLVFAIFFLIFRTLIRFAPGDLPSFALILSCTFATPITLGVVWGLEKWLKQVWPSGYNLVLADNLLQVHQPEQEPLAFHWESNVDVIGWHFSLRGFKRGGQERRVPDNWLCLALQVQQDDHRLISYTFVPPAKAESHLNNSSSSVKFHKINPVEVYGNTLSNRFQPPSRPPSIPTQILNSKDGRYWLAEQRRWQEGLELPFREFEIFLHYLQTQTGSE